MKETDVKHIAIIGAGPSGLFMFKELLKTGNKKIKITLFEKKSQIGAGMPYSLEGASREHITNVSANEIPELVTSVHEWIQTVPQDELDTYNINRNHFNDYKVLPRLLFGQYLEAQFKLLLEAASLANVDVEIFSSSVVSDIIDLPKKNTVQVCVASGQTLEFDNAIVCTGHNWPKTFEGKVKGYFDSPYPPAKLGIVTNHTVAIKGSSLTAVDAIRTLARHNGTFSRNSENKVVFKKAESSPYFKIMMHSRSGLLPAIRFHLNDTHLVNDGVLTEKEIELHKSKNGDFLSLDYIFDEDFKKLLADKDPSMYERVKTLNLEEFTKVIMDYRHEKAPFSLFKSEYREAELSIKREESIYWKELLAVLSFSLNYPAKYLSAEDMMRLKKELMPLISIVIAFLPQASADEMIALHDAGVLDIEAVGEDNEVIVNDENDILFNFKDENGNEKSMSYSTFIDCTGQPHLSIDSFPFPGLVENNSIVQATLKFKSIENGQKEWDAKNSKVKKDKSGNFLLEVPGIAINDSFQIINEQNEPNPRVYVMAVPYIGGYNPDYSGLDFCEEASGRIADEIKKDIVVFSEI